MTKKEAIETLIALAVCSDSKLHCDDDCPFYDKRCEDNFEDNVAEAVKILNKELRGENKMLRKFEYVNRVKIKREVKSNDGLPTFAYEVIKPDFELPKRSTKKSSGYDFIVPEDTICKSHEITMVKSGVKAYFPDDETLLLFNRSSNPKKKGLIILNGVGVVDADYADNPDNEGEIAGLFYNMLDEDIVLKAGEKMMQGVFVNYGITDDDNAEGDRVGGFGSTGK